jgi:hypothetical protein
MIRIFFCTLIILLSVGSINAQSFSQDVVLWTGATITFQPQDSRWSALTFFQLRLINASRDFQTGVGTTIVNYRSADITTVGIGYTALTPINERFTDILFLQTLVALTHEETKFPIRLRIEKLRQNFLGSDLESDGLWRIRLRADIITPLSKSMSYVLNNEVFITPEARFISQNRLQSGVRWSISSNASVDLLYLNRLLLRQSPALNLMEQTLLLHFNYSCNW